MEVITERKSKRTGKNVYRVSHIGEHKYRWFGTREEAEQYTKEKGDGYEPEGNVVDKVVGDTGGGITGDNPSAGVLDGQESGILAEPLQESGSADTVHSELPDIAGRECGSDSGKRDSGDSENIHSIEKLAIWSWFVGLFRK